MCEGPGRPLSELESDGDEFVLQYRTLIGDVVRRLKDRHRNRPDLRILIHVPSPQVSPGGYSLFKNLLMGLRFIGVKAELMEWDGSIERSLRSFQPTVFLTSDHHLYLERINWDSLAEYRASNDLRLGLTASLEEYGNSALSPRLRWAHEHGVDFYYSFRSKEYLRERPEYRPFFDEGYDIGSVEFGANPELYAPSGGQPRDVDFVFLGSAHSDKWERYIEFFEGIVTSRVGFIDGPGWLGAPDFQFNPARDRFVYARAKVGLNLHIENQIEFASELNERTYMLAICGIPQVIDNPKLLRFRFSEDSMFIGETPAAYCSAFEYALNDQEEARRRALSAQREVILNHTVWHRADSFVEFLDKTRSNP